jgi:hypothetical protein
MTIKTTVEAADHVVVTLVINGIDLRKLLFVVAKSEPYSELVKFLENPKKRLAP